MFCPSCRSKIPENLAFCPQCGGKLPKVEKMSANLDQMNIEQAKGAARSGFDPGKFDAGKPFLAQGGGQVPPTGQAQPVKNSPIGTIIGGLITAGIIVAAVMGGDIFGSTRTCVRSGPGSVPECSDCENVYRNTTVNGKSWGSCRAIPGNYNYSDQCNLSCK